MSDNNKIEFTIPCNPPKATHQASLRIMKRKDGTQFVGKFAKSKGKEAQNDLMSLFSPHAPRTPLEGPVRLFIRWSYPYRKAEPKKNRTSPLWCDTRPDCDNLCKMVQDILSRLNFYGDDSQVAYLTFQKNWCDKPGITVMLWELEGDLFKDNYNDQIKRIT